MAERLSEDCNQFRGGGVMVHWMNSWPVSVATNNNEVMTASVRVKVHCILLKWPIWFGFLDKWLSRVRWQIVLTLLTG